MYGITLAGWSSNSKYPFLGGVRSTAQMISYEISLGLSIIPVLLYFGELNLGKIVQHQADHGWLLLPLWQDGHLGLPDLQTALFWIPAFIAFLIFTISIFAETNRMPFDLPECETELVGGYHTEYSSMKFALFFMGEYAAMVIGSALIVTLFLGGWSIGFGVDPWIQSLQHRRLPLRRPHPPRSSSWPSSSSSSCSSSSCAGRVPRFRYDQLMKLGWVIFFEAALINVFLAALILAAPHLTTAILAISAVLLVVVTAAAHPGRQGLRSPPKCRCARLIFASQTSTIFQLPTQPIAFHDH